MKTVKTYMKAPEKYIQKTIDITSGHHKPKKKYPLKDLVAKSSSFALTVEDKQWLGMKDTGIEKFW